MQSPIDLLQGRAEVLPNLGRLKREYKPAEAILMNKGHVIMLQWGEIGAGTIEINQTQYVLKQCHWHSPSEHSLDGSRYDLEMHMVHQRSDGQTAVVAVIYKVGLQDHFLLKVTDAIEDITDKTGSEVKVGLVNPEDAIDLEREPYYRYLGSLTTPPCDEGVMWTVIKERIAMDLCRPTLCCTSSFILFLIITQSVPSAPQKVGNLCHPFSLFLYILQFLFSLFFPDEKEFDYLEGSAKGPKHWGELHPEWKACSNGNMQSPIDLLQGRAEVLPNLGRLKREYKPAEAILMNKGHVIMLQWGEIGAGTIEINQTQYVLKQCHWHSPSEHSLDGSRSDGRTAVVAVIYKVGLQDHFLLKVTDAIEDITDKTGSEVKVGLVNPEDAIDLEREPYYRYLGSLTTPPCDEGVMWTVIKEVKTISKAQLGMLRAAVEEMRNFI
ncbi:hypothetical protein AMTRI_Chr04g186370 [Amborella trichopoda]